MVQGRIPAKGWVSEEDGRPCGHDGASLPQGDTPGLSLPGTSQKAGLCQD